MTQSARLVTVVGLLLVVATGERSYGQDPGRDSLRGVGPVAVLIEDLYREGTEIGLSEAGLEAAVELQLRRNGVALRTDDPSVGSFLYVNVSVLQSTFPVVYTVAVRFAQRATLLANGGQMYVFSWLKSHTGSRPTGTEARARIRDQISTFVDIFSNDYLTVNPQR